MMNVLTVFQVGEENYTIDGVGQSAAKEMRANVALYPAIYKSRRVILRGFVIDGKYHPIKFNR